LAAAEGGEEMAELKTYTDDELKSLFTRVARQAVAGVTEAGDCLEHIIAACVGRTLQAVFRGEINLEDTK